MLSADAQPQPEETDAESRVRQLATFRRLTELNLQAAEIAAARLRDAATQGVAADAASATLDLARASRAAALAASQENRIRRGEDPEPPRPAARPAAPSRTPFDPRRAPLRAALHQAADSEPNRAARAALRRDIDEALEQELLADPDREIPIDEVLCAVCETLDLELDPKNLSDEVLGMPPRTYLPNLAPRPEAFPHDNE